MVSFEIRSIGTLRNERTDVQHTDNWGALRSTITVDERGDHSEPRPYRGRSDLPPVGVFAGRGPHRPNRIGFTCCAIESVRGRELTVVGLDAVSGTPVIDVKRR